MSQYPSNWKDSTSEPGSSQRGSAFRQSFINIKPDELVPPPPPSITAALARHQQQKPTSRRYDDPYEKSGRDYEAATPKKQEPSINEDRIFQELYLLKKETTRLSQELQAMQQEQQNKEATETLRKDVSSLSSEVQTLFAGMSELSGIEDRIQKTVEKYYQKYDNIKIDLKAVEKDVRHVKEDYKVMEKDIKSTKADVRALNAIFGDFSELEMKFEKYKNIEAKLAAVPQLQSQLDSFHSSKGPVHALLDKFQHYQELEKRLSKFIALEKRLSSFGPLENFGKTLEKIEDSLLKKISKLEREISRMEPYEKVQRTVKGVEDYLVKLIDKYERKLADKIEHTALRGRQTEKQLAVVETAIESLKRKATPDVQADEPKVKIQKVTEKNASDSKSSETKDVKVKVESGEPTLITRTFTFEVMSATQMKISGTFEGKSKIFNATIGDIYYSECLLQSFHDDRLKTLNHIIVELAICKKDGKQVEKFSRAWFGRKPRTLRARDLAGEKMNKAHGLQVTDSGTAKVHLIFENRTNWIDFKPGQLTIDSAPCTDLTMIGKNDYAIEYLFYLEGDKVRVKEATLTTSKTSSASNEQSTDSTSEPTEEMSEFNPSEMIVVDSVYDNETNDQPSNATPTRDSPKKPRSRQASESSSKWRPRSLSKSGDIFHAFPKAPKKPASPGGLESVPSLEEPEVIVLEPSSSEEKTEASESVVKDEQPGDRQVIVSEFVAETSLSASTKAETPEEEPQNEELIETYELAAVKNSSSQTTEAQLEKEEGTVPALASEGVKSSVESDLPTPADEAIHPTADIQAISAPSSHPQNEGHTESQPQVSGSIIGGGLCPSMGETEESREDLAGSSTTQAAVIEIQEESVAATTIVESRPVLALVASISESEQPATSDSCKEESVAVTTIVESRPVLALVASISESEQPATSDSCRGGVSDQDQSKPQEISSSEQQHQPLSATDIEMKSMDEHHSEQEHTEGEKVETDLPAEPKVSIGVDDSEDMVSDDIVMALARAADELAGFIVVDEEHEDEGSRPSSSMESAAASSQTETKEPVSSESITTGKIVLSSENDSGTVTLTDGREFEFPSGFFLAAPNSSGDDALVRLAEVQLEDGTKLCEILGVYRGFNKDNLPYNKAPYVDADEIEEEETVYVMIRSLNVQGKNGLFLTGKYRGVAVHIPKTALAGRKLYEILRADVTLKPNMVFSFQNAIHIPTRNS